MTISLNILKVLRWIARAVVLLGILLLLVCGGFLSLWQGFSPDGPPPGFKPLPRILFALLVFPYLFWHSLVEAPWIARPILAYGIIELLWRYAVPSAKKAILRMFICSHALVVLMVVVTGGIIYASLSLYAHRRGPADFCVLNRSNFTCHNTILAGNGFSVPLGTMLPGERRFGSVRPHGKSPVTIRCQANGTNVVMSFTGGLEDTRRFYYQFSIGGDLRGKFNAWRFRDRPSKNDILISNDTLSVISNVVVSGLGFTRTIPNLPSGAKQCISVHPMGPAIVSVEFYTSDGIRKANELGGWGLEGHDLLLSIGDTVDLSFR